ncbi:MAG: hypothetical protein FJZ56_00415 [Chlamydiae bacterium]|nr:hypothetical protein [Chlamydiota bacterium]
MPNAYLFLLLSALVNIIGSFAYVKDTLIGKTRPNRISWFLWFFFPFIASIMALENRQDLVSVIRIFLAGFLPLIVFIASFMNPKSYWKLNHFDIGCGLSAIFAFFLWLFFDSAKIGIAFAVLGDAFAGLPTFIKAYRYPKTETGFTYILSLTAVILLLPTINKWDIENAAFQIYLILANSFLIFSIYRKNR